VFQFLKNFIVYSYPLSKIIVSTMSLAKRMAQILEYMAHLLYRIGIILLKFIPISNKNLIKIFSNKTKKNNIIFNIFTIFSMIIFSWPLSVHPNSEGLFLQPPPRMCILYSLNVRLPSSKLLLLPSSGFIIN